jgi:hypothetical protein
MKNQYKNLKNRFNRNQEIKIKDSTLKSIIIEREIKPSKSTLRFTIIQKNKKIK